MKEERNIIRIDGYGRLNLPTDTTDIWVTGAEIVELFGTTAGAVHAGIKAILEENVLHDYEVCRYIRLGNGNRAERTYITRRSSSPSPSVFVRKRQRDCGNIYSVYSMQ